MTQEEDRLRLVVEAAVMKGLTVAIAHERERCAKIAQDWISCSTPGAQIAAKDILYCILKGEE